MRVVPVAPICGDRDQERTYGIPKVHILKRFPTPIYSPSSCYHCRIGVSCFLACLPGSIFPFSQGTEQRLNLQSMGVTGAWYPNTLPVFPQGTHVASPNSQGGH